MAKQRYCRQCGNVGKPKKSVKGSLIVEIIFWMIGIASLFFFPLIILLPIIYSAWRLFSKRELICRSCKAPNPIPLTSPIAQKALNKPA